MEMICHQTIKEEPKPKPVPVSCHQVEECSAVIVVSENRFSIVAPIHQVKASFFAPLNVAR
jgi:hypothetical protein